MQLQMDAFKKHAFGPLDAGAAEGEGAEDPETLQEHVVHATVKKTRLVAAKGTMAVKAGFVAPELGGRGGGRREAGRGSSRPLL